MQTKYLWVLIHIWIKGEVGSVKNRFKPTSKSILLTLSRRCFFCGSFMLFLSFFLMLSCTLVCWCLVVTCWERAGLLALACDVYLWRCHFPIGILGQVWCLIVSIPYLCPLSYLHASWIFLVLHQQQNLGRRLGIMHLSPSVANAAVRSKGIFLLLLTFV